MSSMQAQLAGKKTELYKNPFMDLRQTVMGLAVHWDKGNGGPCLIDDPEETMGILIRVSTNSVPV